MSTDSMIRFILVDLYFFPLFSLLGLTQKELSSQPELPAVND